MSKSKLSDLQRRAGYAEDALLDLLGRIAALETSLAFEVAQREAMEKVILEMADQIATLSRSRAA